LLLILLGLCKLLSKEPDLLRQGIYPTGQLFVELAQIAVIVNLLAALQQLYLGVELFDLLLALLQIVLQFGRTFGATSIQLGLE